MSRVRGRGLFPKIERGRARCGLLYKLNSPSFTSRRKDTSSLRTFAGYSGLQKSWIKKKKENNGKEIEGPKFA